MAKLVPYAQSFLLGFLLNALLWRIDKGELTGISFSVIIVLMALTIAGFYFNFSKHKKSSG